MRKLYLIAALFLASLHLSAQDPDKVRHIKELMEVTGSGKLGMQVMTNIINSYKQNFPQVSNEFWDEAMKEVHEQDLINLIVPVYEKNFSDEDIQAIITFYKTPVGRRMIEKMPVIMQEAMQAGGDWGKKLSEKILEKLKQKGYAKGA